MGITSVLNKVEFENSKSNAQILLLYAIVFFSVFSILLFLAQDYVWALTGLVSVFVLCVIYVNKNKAKPETEVKISKKQKQLQ